MPLRWKKAKVGRISSFIADLKSKKQQSLVVETGFPTSLLDIVIKNQRRLRKSSKIKRIIEVSPGSFPLKPCNIEVEKEVDIAEKSESFSPVGSDDEICSSSKDDVDDIGDDNTNNRDEFSSFKFSFALFLSFGIKDFVLELMLIAFLLFWLEFVSKHWIFPSRFRDNKSFTVSVEVKNSTSELNFSNSSLVCSETTKCDDLGLKKGLSNSEISERSNSDSIFSCSEISECNNSVPNYSSSEVSVSKNLDGANQISEIGEENFGVKRKRKNLKAKWNKYVTKKILGGKKNKNGKVESSSTVSCLTSTGEKDELGLKKEGNEDEDGGINDENEYVENEECDQRLPEIITVTCPEDCNVMTVNVENRKRRRNHFVLVTVVLSGLVGGRLMALSVTVLWYILVKLMEILWIAMNKKDRI